MTQVYEDTLQTCLTTNPDVNFVLWNDWNIEIFIDKYYPTDSPDSATQKLRQLAMNKKMLVTIRSDVLRYMLLKEFGGVYMDLDTICNRPLFDSYLNDFTNNVCLIGNDPLIQTRIFANLEFLASPNFLAAPASHPFLRLLVANVKDADGNGTR